MKYKHVLLVNNQQTAVTVWRANSFLTRLRGLLFRKSMPPNTALLITPCNAIHCLGMLFSIDVVFLGKHLEVVQINHRLRPFFIAFNLKAKHVLEMPAGSIAALSLKMGDTIQLEQLT